MKALEDGDKGQSRQSLREQFKRLRLREEAGIQSLDDTEQQEGGAIAGLIGRSTSLGVGIGSPGKCRGRRKAVTTSTSTKNTHITNC